MSYFKLEESYSTSPEVPDHRWTKGVKNVEGTFGKNM